MLAQIAKITLLYSLLSIPVSAAPEIQSRIVDERSCYAGEWGSLEAYLARPATKKVYEDAQQRERAEQRYRYWRANFDCRWITYPVDDLEIQGFIVRPAGVPPEGGWPVVIFNHGGNADIGQVRFQYIAARLFPLVEKGFVVVGSQYRGTKIDGAENPHRLRDEFGGDDVNDVRALVSIIESLPYANAERIGMWGMSRGGMMSFIAARGSDAFDAIVVEGTPTDQLKALEQRPGMEEVLRTWIPDYEQDKESALKERSAVYWIDELDMNMPILILHGSDDARVSVSHALELADALQARNHPHRLVIYDGGSHGLREHHQEAMNEVISWFHENLRMQ